MIRPIRLRLSRAKGFNLQAHSFEVNGLPAVNCARPSIWGNPFLVHPQHKPGRVWNGDMFSVATAEDAVSCFREMMECETPDGTRAAELRKRFPELRGHNLACWCPLDGRPCHADVLLELANPSEGER